MLAKESSGSMEGEVPWMWRCDGLRRSSRMGKSKGSSVEKGSNWKSFRVTVSMEERMDATVEDLLG